MMLAETTWVDVFDVVMTVLLCLAYAIAVAVIGYESHR